MAATDSWTVGPPALAMEAPGRMLEAHGFPGDRRRKDCCGGKVGMIQLLWRSRPARAMPRWLMIWTTLQLTPETALGVSAESRSQGCCQSLYGCKRRWTGLRHRPCCREVEVGTCAPGTGLDFDVTTDWVHCTLYNDNDSSAKELPGTIGRR